MPQYKRIAETVLAEQWNRAGDLSGDKPLVGGEGRIVVNYARKDVHPDAVCARCKQPMRVHGWIHPPQPLAAGVQVNPESGKPIFVAGYAPGVPQFPAVFTKKDSPSLTVNNPAEAKSALDKGYSAPNPTSNPNIDPRRPYNQNFNPLGQPIAAVPNPIVPVTTATMPTPSFPVSDNQATQPLTAYPSAQYPAGDPNIPNPAVPDPRLRGQATPYSGPIKQDGHQFETPGNPEFNSTNAADPRDWQDNEYSPSNPDALQTPRETSLGHAGTLPGQPLAGYPSAPPVMSVDQTNPTLLQPTSNTIPSTEYPAAASPMLNPPQGVPVTSTAAAVYPDNVLASTYPDGTYPVGVPVPDSRMTPIFRSGRTLGDRMDTRGLVVCPGDWVITYASGEHEICTPGHFPLMFTKTNALESGPFTGHLARR